MGYYRGIQYSCGNTDLGSGKYCYHRYQKQTTHNKHIQKERLHIATLHSISRHLNQSTSNILYKEQHQPATTDQQHLFNLQVAMTTTMKFHTIDSNVYALNLGDCWLCKMMECYLSRSALLIDNKNDDGTENPRSKFLTLCIVLFSYSLRNFQCNASSYSFHFITLYYFQS